MKRMVKVLLALGLLLLVLSGCGKKSTQGKDYVKIYDHQNHLLKKLTTAKSIRYFSDYVGDAAGSDTKTNANQKIDEKISKAKVSYKYLMHQAKGDVNSTMTVYSNVKYGSVDNIAGFGKANFKMSDKAFKTFNHPKQLIKKLEK
ncbi:hypothetical protein LNP07_04905 [Apilactobacillus sp. M161]|uniref:DUF1307 domain-containing protein n=1 Tax=Apilactobacillus xinyiensis TaxID=2841032 RepID=A0ABT0I2A8_9LACO|nr:hypothetical protein [Apilactobacillus xinyiensis]MCK8624852.1 hypothetical protein [Apilactobacillus xinyiensis]